MSDYDQIPAIVEGKLHAQRHVLAALVAAVLEGRSENRERLRLLVSRDTSASDQAEDPGALPDRAFAVEASTAEELRLIAEEVERLRAVQDDHGNRA